MHTVARTSRAVAPVIPVRGRLQPIGVESVGITGGFWGDLQALNREAIIPHAIGWVEKLGWLANLENARGAVSEHRGREFADSEVYKLIEAMSWEHGHGQTELDEILDRFLEIVCRAQDPDGYLHTLFGRPWQRPRYSDFQWGHELYCFGHLLQAAVAHLRSTRSDRLLDVAIRLGDHICVMFGPGGLDKVCGHAEVELGLVELYRVTGERRYLDQASLFIERRGKGTLPKFEFGTAFWQDDMPVRAAEVLRGHAVRALYLSAAAVDVAIETGDEELLNALILQWDNTVAKRTYITGGMGSHHMDEAFGDDFVLPADRSYCETCAGVASIMFSWRLLLATGHAKYADLIERTLYNVVATSPAPDGRSFFYANTLHQRVEHSLPTLNDDGVVIRGGASGRQPWFEVSCCPPNVARMLASLGAYLATGEAGSIQLHQYASGQIRVEGAVIDVATDYPANGTIEVSIRASAGPLDVSFRVPEWAVGAVVVRDGVQALAEPGYPVVEGLHAGDQFVIELPMDVRRLIPDARADAIRGTVAFQRGPEIFALESLDLPDGWAIDDVLVTSRAASYDGDVVIELVRRTEKIPSSSPSLDDPEGVATPAKKNVSLVRYHDWASRGPSTMRVWIPII